MIKHYFYYRVLPEQVSTHVFRIT